MRGPQLRSPCSLSPPPQPPSSLDLALVGVEPAVEAGLPREPEHPAIVEGGGVEVRGRCVRERDGWREWPLPGDNPMAYAVYVDEDDRVWVTDFGANALVRFDPGTEEFDTFELPSPDAQVRQLPGRPGEVWGAESAVDKLVVARTR